MTDLQTTNSGLAAEELPEAKPAEAKSVGAAIAKGALSAAFGKATRFIHGELTAASLDAVTAMHNRFNQQIDDKVAAALPENASDALKAAATNYCIALSRTRTDMPQKQFKEKVAGGEDALNLETRSMMRQLYKLEEDLKKALAERRPRNIRAAVAAASGNTALPMTFEDLYNPPKPATPVSSVVSFFKKAFGLNAAKPVKTTIANTAEAQEMPAAANDDTDRKTAAQKFMWGEDQRIYFKLSDASTSPVLPFVEKYLTEKGYTVSDYAGGYARDQRKNTIKIGKLLKDEPALLQAYQEDPYRLNSGSLMVVLTRSYEDLARASYARGWQSCRADSYTAVRYGVAEIDLGVIAAYLVRGDDPEIHNPLGRINMKPYHRADNKGAKGDTIYMTFNPIGLHHPGFVDAVNNFAEEHLNGEKYGKFKLPAGCESYRELQERTRIPDDAESALKALGADYTKDKNGKLSVHGNLDMSNLGIAKLPDLRDVIVTGGIDVSHNKLLTLEGLPTAPIAHLDASYNLLTCFAGCTPEITGTFSYRDNAYLITTFGAPKAGSYSFGNGQRDSGNYAHAKECVGPLEQPQRFPGFKRKD
ncbi:MAG: hypothetical protein PW788_04840 [Micavibrio sp.]|nr:hypothetical protein [Micavibrio sp.]